jgi:hypothetical protein
MNHLKLSIESWAPEYGTPVSDTILESTKVQVDVDIEIPAIDWRPVPPRKEVRGAERIIFVDGVRRMEAIVWISEEGKSDQQGICASYAAGALEAGLQAKVIRAEVCRGLFSGHPGVQPINTGAVYFDPVPSLGEGITQLQDALGQTLNNLEVDVAESVADRADLIVVDGPLKGHRRLQNAVGYIKTHQISYLPDTVAGVVADLPAGYRTPVFITTTSWTRYSWYMRLPGTKNYSWAGIVRLESSAKMSVPDVIKLADQISLTLPKYASLPYKDPRAPQNLFPIGGLENELRRRLGDPYFIYRALRKGVVG